MKHARRGIVLSWALVTMTISTIILGGLAAYFTNTARLAKGYTNWTADRFAGQYALEDVKARIESIIGKINPSNSPEMAITTGSAFKANLEQAIRDIKTLISSPVKTSDKKYEIVFEDANGTLDDIAKDGNGRLKLRARVYYAGGVNVSGPLITLEEDIVFETDTDNAMTTMEIFDYVYFANNCGHLDGSVVANGDIGANGTFVIEDTRVNGYVRVRGTSESDENACILRGAPKMWPYHTYMTRVTDKITDSLHTLYPGLSTAGLEYYTQIRPTNPVYVSDEVSIQWDGGYEPPGFTTEYGEVLGNGTFSGGTPGNEYAEEWAKYQQGYPNEDKLREYYDYDANSGTCTAKENPLQDDYDTYYSGGRFDNSIETEYRKYYNDNGTKKSYSTVDSRYSTYFNNDGSPKSYTYDERYYSQSGTPVNYYDTHADYRTYYDRSGNKLNNSNKSMYDLFYDSNGRAKSNGYKSGYDTYWEVVEKREYNWKTWSYDYYTVEQQKDNPYSWLFERSEYNNWNNNKSAWAKNGSNYNAYHLYEDNKANWSTSSQNYRDYTAWIGKQNAAGDAYNTWKGEQQAEATKASGWRSTQSSIGTAASAWQAQQNAVDVSAYNDWAAGKSGWQSGGSQLKAYNDWNTSQTAWGKDYTDWTTKRDDVKDKYDQWEADFGDLWNDITSGEKEVDLTKETAHVTATGSSKIINVSTHVVEVPNLSDTNIQEYIDYCHNFTTNKNVGSKGGWLVCSNCYDTATLKAVRMTLENTHLKRVVDSKTRTILGGTPVVTTNDTPHVRTLNVIDVSGGDGSDVVPITNPTDSPFNDSGIPLLESGSAILIGTYDYPIMIDGPVYFPGDVVIRGFVSGQGSIYAGRNIHIVGDITYKNPPSWPHNNLSLPKNYPTKVADRNRRCDILLLVARGNIVVGDYSSDLWQGDANMQYLKSYSPTGENPPAVCNTFGEADLGYNAGFDRDYTQKDGGTKITAKYNSSVREWREDVSLVEHWNHVTTTDTLEAKVTEDRRYYESIFGDKVISELKQAITTDPDKAYKMPTSVIQVFVDFLNMLFGNYKQTVEQSHSPLDGDVMQIDAVLFANHGIFGVVGGANAPQFTLNGAMLCRDEGLLPSFTTRFANRSDQKIWLNWDMRIKSNSREGLSNVGAPSTNSGQVKSVDVYVDSWKQVR